MTAWMLTWLWQGIALTLTVALLLKAQRLNASTRHVIWWSALVAVIWLGGTSSPYRSLEPIQVPMEVLVRGADPNGMEFAPEPYLLVTQASSFFVSIFLGVWAAIAAIRLIRLIPGLHAIYALRDRCRPLPVDIESRLPLWLEAKTRGRRTELMICDAVPGATVLGFQRPFIAIPSSLVEALTVEELDQIILHELAHVQRRDDWARLAQGLLEAALWIHPAVACISRALNRERETACDEFVVARTGLPKVYARCLTRAAEVRSCIRIEPVLVPALFFGRHDLVRRVDRLLAVKGRTRCKVSLVAAGTAACAIVMMSVRLNAVPLIGESVAVVLPEVAAPVPRMARATVSAFALTTPFATADKPLGSAFALTAPIATADKSAFALTAPIATADKSAFAHLRTPLGRDRTVAPIAPNALIAPSAPNAPIAPNAPNAPITGIAATETLHARSFEGAYERPTEGASSSVQPSPWRAATNTGVEIGSAARKTGVGIAGFFGRAGVSLARRF